MDVQRAKEILHSEDIVNVEWNGRKIWIDSVDTESHTAQIHVKHQSEEQQFVPVSELHEG